MVSRKEGTVAKSLILPLHLKIQSDSFYLYLSFDERKPILQAR